MRRLLLLPALACLSACAVNIDEASLLPTLDAPAATMSATAPAGYTLTETLLPVSGLGVVHAIRLDRPDSDATVIFSGGSGYFTATSSRRLARLAEVTGADIVTYDYPGRGGTTTPRTAQALIDLGPALVQAFRQAGWIGGGPLYAHGFSFGGAQAAGMARAGGFSGLILEGTSSDIPAVARNMVPGAMRPLLRLRIDEDLQRFDYFGYAVAAKAPVLVLAGRDDEQVDEATVRAFAAKLKQSGADVSLSITPGGHSSAFHSQEAGVAVREFMARTGAR